MEEINKLIRAEQKRQKETLMLVPSENYAFPEIAKSKAEILNNKYSEGYSGKRYYQGNAIIDQIENLAIEGVKRVFGVEHVNVQPYSGSPANSAVEMAILENGDTLMGLSLSGGGHLTHGHPKITFSGRFFNSVQYDVNADGWIDYDDVEKLAVDCKPKLIVCGTTAYPRTLDFEKFGKIADQVGAYLMADISHIAGLVAGGVHPSPVPFVDVVTTTTHKTLRGPRGAVIMVTQKGIQKDKNLGIKIDKAVFPGLQGGPHNATTAGIAITMSKILSENRESKTHLPDGQVENLNNNEDLISKEFRDYAGQIVKNAKVLSEELIKYGFNLVTGGTDNHLMVIDLRNKNITGKEAAVMLEEAGIVLNANAIPHDPSPPFKPSGIRLGTPALTSRGMKEGEMKKIGGWMAEILESKIENRKSKQKIIKNQIKEMCRNFKV